MMRNRVLYPCISGRGRSVVSFADGNECGVTEKRCFKSLDLRLVKRLFWSFMELVSMYINGDSVKKWLNLLNSVKWIFGIELMFSVKIKSFFRGFVRESRCYIIGIKKNCLSN